MRWGNYEPCWAQLSKTMSRSHGQRRSLHYVAKLHILTDSGCVCWPTAASKTLRLTTLLRSSDKSLAVEHVNTSDQPRRQPYWYHPVARCSTLGDRSFPVAAARAWNALPQHVRNASSLSVFRRELKTVLFRLSFPDATWQCTVLCLRARRSVLICHHVLVATNWFC